MVPLLGNPSDKIRWWEAPVHCMENGQDPTAAGKKVGFGLAGLGREGRLLRGPRKLGWRKPKEGPGGALEIGSGPLRQKPEPGPQPFVPMTAPGSGHELCGECLGDKDLVESAVISVYSLVGLRTGRCSQLLSRREEVFLLSPAFCVPAFLRPC